MQEMRTSEGHDWKDELTLAIMRLQFMNNISVKAIKLVLWLAVKSTLSHDSQGTRGVISR